MKLDYVDLEDSLDREQDKKIHRVSGFMAGRAYNDICKMIGGRFPDLKLEAEAPFTHEFFMHFFKQPK